MMMSITLAIGITRALCVKSECEVFGRVWTKAILSEYDKHLYDDYRIIAYFGNEAEVQKKIDSYIMYSAANKLDASINKSSAELSGYELANPDNFRKSLKQNTALTLLEKNSKVFEREKRTEDNTEEKYESRKIKNNVVLDTLPSCGMSNTLDVQGIASKVKEDGFATSLKNMFVNAGVEGAFIATYFGNHVTKSKSKDGYFCNEWEYIINGQCDDDKNLKVCKEYIFAIRNAMNIEFLLTNPEKKAVIASVSEILTPGATGILTNAVIAEMWAAIETKKDLDALMDNERVPFVKTSETWQTDISSLLDGNEIKEKLNDEGKALLEENIEEIESLKGAKAIASEVKEGQTYDDYLMAMMTLMNDNLVTLRLMDLVQINMKYRYYEDFNMSEYYIGTRFTIKANGKDYEFEDCYK